MNREQGFKHFYKSDITHSLVYTEKERKGIVFQLALCIVIPIIVIPILSVVYLETNMEWVLIPVIVLLVGSPIYINKLFGDTNFYRNFKRKIIGKIIKYINPSLDYDNVLKVDDIEYDNSKFFENTNTVLYGDDHVSGVINDIRVEFSELVAEFRNVADQKEAGSKYQFKGLFFIAEYKTYFPSQIVIKTAGLLFHGSEYDVTKNENFNTLFKSKVISNRDKTEKVLTPEVLSLIIDLQAKIHNEFMISFIDNKIYLGIQHDEDLFEPTLFQSMKNYDKIKGYFDDLYYPLTFLEEITKLRF